MDGIYACGMLRRSLVCSSFNYARSTSCGPVFTYAMYGRHLQRAPMQAKVQIFSLKNASRACTVFRSFPKVHLHGMLQLVIDEESSPLGQPHLIIGSSLEPNKSTTPATRSDEYLEHDLHGGLQDKTDGAIETTNICDKEIQRRRKIGLANKGKTPWNKGRRHSQETRERIKKRTIEALRDPKVRKKMSEYPHSSHSDQSKARISAALRRIWEDRLKRKRSQEKCYLIWAISIAEAARVGAHDQHELEWDSYEKLKAEITSQHLRKKLEKANAKETAKLRADRMAKVRAEKLAMLSQRREVKEEKARARKIKAVARKKSEDEKKKMALSSKCIKLRLTKFQCSKKQLASSDSIGREMVIEPRPITEKWDIERIKIEKMRRRVSLADQIRALKNKKAEFAAHEVVETGTSDSSVQERDGGS